MMAPKTLLTCSYMVLQPIRAHSHYGLTSNMVLQPIRAHSHYGFTFNMVLQPLRSYSHYGLTVHACTQPFFLCSSFLLLLFPFVLYVSVERPRACHVFRNRASIVPLDMQSYMYPPISQYVSSCILVGFPTLTET